MLLTSHEQKKSQLLSCKGQDDVKTTDSVERKAMRPKLMHRVWVSGIQQTAASRWGDNTSRSYEHKAVSPIMVESVLNTQTIFLVVIP